MANMLRSRNMTFKFSQVWLAFALVLLSVPLVSGEASAQTRSGGRFIVNQLSGRCIDVAGAPGTGNGAPIILYDCELSGRNPNGSQTDQQWTLDRSGLIRNRLSGKCIDVPGAPGTANGARLRLWECEVAGGPTDQLWGLE